MVTAEWWERPEGVGGAQQRGTALSQGFSESQGEQRNTSLLKDFLIQTVLVVSCDPCALLWGISERFL